MGNTFEFVQYFLIYKYVLMCFYPLRQENWEISSKIMNYDEKMQASK